MQLSKPELDAGIASLNVPRLQTFYRDVLGFATLPDLALGPTGKMSRVQIGQHTLKLYDFVEKPEPCEGGTDKAIGFRLLAFIFDDLAPVLARLDAAGVPYRQLKLPSATEYSVAFASDPDGNALELVGLNKQIGDKLTVRMQIGLTVGDTERSRKFYAAMGFAEQPEMQLPASMGVVGNVRYGFTAGGSTIKFWSRGELPTRSGQPGKLTGIRLITAFVDDVDATCAQLRERGIEIKVPPFDMAGLARVMFVTDPDGNWIEFAARPKR